MRIVLRNNSTKYVSTRSSKVHANGIVDVVVYHPIKPIKMLFLRRVIIETPKPIHINQCSAWVQNKQHIPRQGAQIGFECTLYKLTKCKGKNDQRPGKKALWEIKNPRHMYIRKKLKIGFAQDNCE